MVHLIALYVGLCYIQNVHSVTLSYKLKLYPTRVKADTLALLSSLFRRAHTECTTKMRQGEGRLPSTRGLGSFIGITYRRAYIDYIRAHKMGHEAGALKAELIDAAELQVPRRAKGFDYWVMIKGTTRLCGRREALYVPARGHKALNRTLALPGAQLRTGHNTCAEVVRKNGKWYAYVYVTVPLAEVQVPNGWLGCDVGIRACVTRSDGYQGPDLRPIIRYTRNRKADQQRNGIDRQTMTCQRQILSGEARLAVSVAQRSGRGVSLEDPRSLPRYKQWAARLFAKRVQLLAAIGGVPVVLLNPSGTSLTCSRCGFGEKRQRHKEAFRCWRCGYTTNADANASLNICRWAHRYYDSQHDSPSLSSEVEVDE